MRKMPHGVFVLRLFFVYVVGKNPKTPNLIPMADDATTRGGIGGLGSPVYIYGPKVYMTRRWTLLGSWSYFSDNGIKCKSLWSILEKRYRNTNI